MFTIYHSNQLDILKDLLVELIRRAPLQNPLEDEQILVQSPGMAQWLRQQLAEGLGIAASIDFPLPASFLWDMFVRVLPGVPKRSAFNKEAMTWKLVTLLPELVERDSFAPLRHYLADDSDGVRCYQLAEKVSDIFDQYLVYRPDWIEAWEKGEDPESVATEQPWQPELWRELVAKTSDMGQSHWHRANMHQHFLKALHQEEHGDHLPGRLFVFGISAMPPHFVETLKALGQQTDVHLLVCNPCRHYWGDERDPKYMAKLEARRFTRQLTQDLALDEIIAPARQQNQQPGWLHKVDPSVDPEASGNPLLGSMGKLGRDYFHQLHGLDATEIDAFVDGSESTLLHRLQSDILELQDSTVPGATRTTMVADESIAIHSCHSPLREVEVLHDQLLAMFEQDPELKPRDIVVMLPDVDDYSPWIQAVFAGMSSDRQDARRIPFAISDRSARNEHPMLSGLLQLLDLDNSRCTAPELLELLEIPALQKRFGFNSDSFTIIRDWVENTGIRWGLDPEHQVGFDLPPRDSNSWLFGLRRMLLGYAMPEETGLYDNILPFEPIQGMNAALCGQLASFIEQAEQLVETLPTPRTVDDWSSYINQLMERFFDPEESDEFARNTVRKALENLHQQVHDAGYHEKLSRSVLLDYLTERLTSERSSQKFLAGQVNFCTLMPMRSIPFKVVCLLGMSDGAYPRSLPPAGFDLIARNSRRGDRSRRDDDRYLFLEALLSARQKLYISYVGKSIRDSSSRVASVLVTELLDYLDQSLDQSFSSEEAKLSSQLLKEHRLQPFSPDNFRPDSEHCSFAKEWLPAATHFAASEEQVSKDFMSPALLPANEKPEELDLSELLRFYRNPCQYFCNRRLKVFFEDQEEGLKETEPFSIDGLEAYQLKTGVLDSLLKENDFSDYHRLLQATGTLPHGAFGELLLEAQFNDLFDLANGVKDTTTCATDDIEVQLSLSGLCLNGWLRHCYQSGLVRYRPAKIKGKDILRGWIEHLAYCASVDNPGTTQLLALDSTLVFQPVDSVQATDLLTCFIDHYLEGMNRPLPLFPQTALAWLENCDDEEKAEKEALTAFEGGYMRRGENEDVYINRIYPELPPVLDQLKDLSLLLLQPALSNCRADHDQEEKA